MDTPKQTPATPFSMHVHDARFRKHHETKSVLCYCQLPLDVQMFDMSDSEIQVIAAVLIRHGRFLVCQRPAHKRHGSLWEFPGGKLERGESLLSAATRELSEELDLTVTSIGATRFIAHDPGSNFVINFVDVEASGIPKPLEHSSVNWCSPDELLTLPLAPSDLLFAQQIAQDYSHGNTLQATRNQNPQ